MKKIFKTLLFAFIVALLIGCKPNNTKCILRGEFVGFDDLPTEIWLENMLFADKEVYLIPIIDGKFECEIDATHLQLFFSNIDLDDEELPIALIVVPQPGVVSVKIHSGREYFDALEVIKGEETQKALNYLIGWMKLFEERRAEIQKQIEELKVAGLFYSEKMKELEGKYRNADNLSKEEIGKLRSEYWSLTEAEEGFTPDGFKLKKQLDSIFALQNRYILEIDLNYYSIASYFDLINTLLQIEYYEGVSLEELMELANQYFKKFPNHPYTDYLKTRLAAMENIQVGNRFVDFSAPDLEGSIHTLSEIIEGKYALLYLWASWCGPCRTLLEAMVPVYEDFKDKGFTMVAIASENDHTIENLKKFLESKNYPWLNLVELNGENNIWPRYNAAGAGFSYFIDNTGTILKIGNHPDSIRVVLNEKLR